MSRPRYWWDGTVKKAVRMYYRGGLDADTAQGAVMRIAIDRAMEATEKVSDGRDRMRVIEALYRDGLNNIAFAADVVHVSERTAQRWVAEFVRSVGRNAGYL